MLRSKFVIGVAVMFPLLAGAIETPPPSWTNCETDYDCAVVQGPCSPIAMNYGIQKEAAAFYAKQAKDITCVKRFWNPSMAEVDARCRLGRCEIVGK